MHKIIVYLKRPTGTTREEFLKWYFDVHVPLVKSAGGFERYTASIVVDSGPASPWPDGEPPFELVAEVWCEDLDAVRALKERLQNNGAAADSAAHTGERMAVITEEVILQ